MLQVGTIHTMTIENKVTEGYQLKKAGEHALLPFAFSDRELVNGELMDVFLYVDKKEQLIASTKQPKVVVGSYDWVEVKDVIPNLGVFVDIGIEEEILISQDELPLFKSVWPQPNDKLYVTLKTDKRHRLLAEPAKEKEFGFGFVADVELNDKVTGRAIRVDREGTVIMTEEDYRGFIHYTECEKEPRLGEEVTGRIIEVKEDGTLNISLMPLKQERIDNDAEKILSFLENTKDGVMPFGDKSDPASILKTFQMSKSAFKRALGRLMKERKIEQRDGKTYLL